MPLRLAVLLAAVALAAAPGTASAALHLTPLGTDFSSPVYVTAPPGDPHRVFVVERSGKIVEIRDGVEQATPFLDITPLVRSGGEQGLLSMAFAPDYATSGRYYVDYTAPRPGDASGSILTVDEISPAGRRNVFTVDHPNAGNHNAGQLQFGPDGLLYATTGDGGTRENAQDLSSLLGKVLRVNPLNGAAPEIYAYGLRNPFRFSFDRQTGDLIIADVGQSAREEVDFSPAGTAAGVNYGWPCREGTIAGPGGCTATGTVVDPVLEKNHDDPSTGGDGYCAIIGGFVARNQDLTGLNGRYVYGDNCNTHVRSVTLPAATDDADTGLDVAGLSSFGEDSCGHLYATSLGGTVYRIDGDAFTPCPEAPATPSTTPPGGSGAPATPPGGGGPQPIADTRAPVVRIGSLRRRSARRVRSFRIALTCDELCGATVTGKLRVRGVKRAFTLARVVRQIAVGKRVKVRIKPSRRALRALHRHRRGTASFRVTARDAARNAGTASRRILLSP